MTRKKVGRREFLAATGVALGAGISMRAWGQDVQAAAAMLKAVPKLSAPLADPYTQGAGIFDVRPLDYVAEEYLMTGTAPSYPAEIMGFSPDPTDMTVPVPVGSGPYTTRIVMYRPSNMKRFSGNVIVETSGIVFSSLNKFFAERGDVSVHVNQPQGQMRTNFGDRYSGVSITGPNQLSSILAQAGALMKSPSSPIGVPASRMYMTGWSITAGAVEIFARGFHNQTRLPNGKPLFDGYLPMCNAGHVLPIDVPMMFMVTQSDYYGFTDNTPLRLELRFNNDQDGPAIRGRYYEVPGAIHAPFPAAAEGSAIPAAPRGQRNQNILDLCRPSFPREMLTNDIPTWAIMEGMFTNMTAWVEQGIAPPHAPLMDVARHAKKGQGAHLDDDGNATGGLRLPDLQVPIATYGIGQNSCQLTGYKLLFTPERCRELYHSKAEYLGRYGRVADAMVTQRFFSVEAAGRMKANAAHGAPDF